MDISDGTQQTIWSANCGRLFGHELMLSKTLEAAMIAAGLPHSFEMVKNAFGGSLLSRWNPPDGEFWPALRNTIRSREGDGNNWRGFFWHQGKKANVFFVLGEHTQGILTYHISTLSILPRHRFERDILGTQGKLLLHLSYEHD